MPSSALASGGVREEIRKSVSKQNATNKWVLFPIDIDGYVFQAAKLDQPDDGERAIAQSLVNHVCLDAKGWKNDAAFEVLLERLLADLQIEERPSTAR